MQLRRQECCDTSPPRLILPLIAAILTAKSLAYQSLSRTTGLARNRLDCFRTSLSMPDGSKVFELGLHWRVERGNGRGHNSPALETPTPTSRVAAPAVKGEFKNDGRPRGASHVVSFSTRPSLDASASMPLRPSPLSMFRGSSKLKSENDRKRSL